MAITSVTSTIAGQLSTRRDVLTYTTGLSATQAVDATSTKLDQILIDNTAGTAAVYLRLWDHASPTVGTTIPVFILTAGAGESVEYSFIPAPVMDTALVAQVSQSKGYAASPTAVTWTVTVTFLTHD
jgi:hypothetical protein